MNKLSYKHFSMPAVFLCCTLIIEIITFLTLGFGFLPKYFLLDIALMIIITSIIFIIPNKIAQMCFVIIFLGAQIILSYTNVTLYEVYGDLMSLDMIFLGGEAFKAFDFSFVNWWFIVALFLVYVATITILALDLKSSIKSKFKYHFKSMVGIIVLSIFICMGTFGVGTYTLQVNNLYSKSDTVFDEYFNNDSNLYQTLFIKNDAFKKFGTFGFYFKNLNNMIFKTKFTLEDMNNSAEYIKTAPITQKNEKTGLLQNDNVIFIMAESFEWFGIDPIFTPNLYQFMNESYQFSKYYSKNKTNFTEINVILGNSPTENGFTTGYNDSSSKLLNNVMPTTLPNKLKNDANFDQANYFHNFQGAFYGRNKSHIKFGFDNFYGMEDLVLDDLPASFGNFPRDSDLFKNNMELIAPKNKKFLSYITTVTSHGPYTNNSRLQEYYDALEDEQKLNDLKNYIENETDFIYPTTEKDLDYFKCYKAAMMDLDKGIEYLVDYLKSNDLYNNTTIVMFSDHYAYYNDLCYTMKGIDKGQYYNTEAYRVPFVIHSTKLGKAVDDTFVCSYNILPTILDLVGVNYNQNMYMGYSVFDPLVSKTIFVSSIGGIMTDAFYTDDFNEIYYYGVIIDKEGALDFKLNAYDFYYKLDYINKIYNTNVFKYRPDILKYV